MSFEDVIVYVDGTEASKARDRFAVHLAKDHNARLVGIAFAPQALMPLYGADVAFADMSGVFDSVKVQGKEALARFEETAKAVDAPCDINLMQGTSDELPYAFASAARLADLAILGQPRDGDPLVGQYALVERCLFASGRPVLIVPASGGQLERGGTIVVAWDGSAEAARASGDALPFLKEAARVVLLSCVRDGSSQDSAPSVEGIVAHLCRHGVRAEARKAAVSEGGDIGRHLLRQSKDLGADMIVMGAFHHSRWREFILGGVTLTMLEEAVIPLFMAH